MTRNRSKAQRRLAAILCADVSGYSRLMNSDQTGTLRLLASHREITDRLIAHHGGRIANTAGRQHSCRVSQRGGRRALRARHAGEGRGGQLARGRDIFGDDVSIAARLQSVAVPGSICLSGAAYNFARDSVALPFENLGPQEVKNFATPVMAYLLRPAGGSAQRAIPMIHRVEMNLMRRCFEQMSAAVGDIAGPHGLEPIEAALLASLRDAPGIAYRDVAERVGLDPRRCLRLTKHLEKLGLIRNSGRATDRSAKALMLTQAGQRLCKRIIPPIMAAQDRIMAPLSEADRETLRGLLARIVHANEAKSR